MVSSSLYRRLQRLWSRLDRNAASMLGNVNVDHNHAMQMQACEIITRIANDYAGNTLEFMMPGSQVVFRVSVALGLKRI